MSRSRSLSSVSSPSKLPEVNTKLTKYTTFTLTEMMKFLVLLAILAVSFAFIPHKASRSVVARFPNSIVSTMNENGNLKISETLMFQSEKSDVEEKPTEKKYLYAAGVFLFACLYDFFITHGGHPYLVHPPVPPV
jgi:hypothetical protein